MNLDRTVRSDTHANRNGLLRVAYDLQLHARSLHPRLKHLQDRGRDCQAAFLADVENHHGCISIAETNGVVGGFCSWLSHCDTGVPEEPSHYTYPYVRALGVLKSHRNTGIAAALLKRAAIIAQSKGQEWLRTSVLAANVIARRFCERQRFRKHLIELDGAL